MSQDNYAEGQHYDAVIVGSGVYGSLVAKRLGERGWRVLVLEAGTTAAASWEGYTEAVRGFRAALTKSPNSPYLPNPAAPSPDATDPDGYFVQNPVVSPYGSDYLRARGGTTLHWEGVVPRMHEADLLMHTRYEHGRDWPFAHETGPGGVERLSPKVLADLRKYYKQAEFELGVSGNQALLEGSGITIPDYVYPMHEIPQTYLDQQLAEGIGDLEVTLDRAGGHKVSPRLAPAPQARNGTPNAEYDNGRGYRPHGAVGMPNYGERCVGNSSCIPICPVQAKYTPLRTQAQCDPDLVTIATRRVVNRVLFRENGRATGVEYQVYDDPRSTAASTHYVTGSVVVLAAHAIENAKLLLASDVRNQAVGRHLMDHPLVVTQALVPEELSRNLGPHRGPAATSFIDQFRDGPWRESMAAFRVGVFNWGWGFKAESFSREVRALADHGTLTPTNGSDGPNSPMIGRKMRQALVEHMPRQFQLEFMLEQTPKWTNRVTIDRAHRDRLGNFRPVISYGIDEYVRAGVRQAIEVSEQINAKLGAKEWNFTPKKRTEHRKGEETVIEILQAGNHGHHYEVLGARHGAGTHLMGTEPTTSVVDEYQRCHQHQNLYAVGCGSMVTIGTSNPTLTGAMLALRSADQMHRDLMELNRPANIAARVG